MKGGAVAEASVVVAVPITVEPIVLPRSSPSPSYTGGFSSPRQTTHSQSRAAAAAAGQNAIAPPFGAEPGGMWKSEKYCGGITCIIFFMGCFCACCCPCDGTE